MPTPPPSFSGSFLSVPVHGEDASSMSDISAISNISSKTYITEESSLVLETVEAGIRHHYLIPIQVGWISVTTDNVRTRLLKRYSRVEYQMTIFQWLQDLVTFLVDISRCVVLLCLRCVVSIRKKCKNGPHCELSPATRVALGQNVLGTLWTFGSAYMYIIIFKWPR